MTKTVVRVWGPTRTTVNSVAVQKLSKWQFLVNVVRVNSYYRQKPVLQQKIKITAKKIYL